MAKNPFLKADDKTLRINGNFAFIIFTDKKTAYDEQTGEIVYDETQNSVEIPISNPSMFNEHVIDGKNFVSGDLKFEVSRLALENALPSNRTPDMNSCGIDKTLDKIKLGTEVYHIVRIEALNVWGNIPSRYKFHVRSE